MVRSGRNKSVKNKYGRLLKAGKETALSGVVIAAGVLICLPVVFLLSGSITGKYEMMEALSPVLTGDGGHIRWNWLPEYPEFTEYGKLLFSTPQFFVLFWNSIKITGLILAGQLATAVPAAWAFAVFRFRLRRLLFTVYIVLMLLPFQVTMLSQYLVLDRLSILNTQWAVILPAAFSAFPVFLIYRSFRTIPESLLEAACIDGAGDWYTFFTIGVPLGSGGIMSALVLNFLEYWNLIEQPLAFLKDRALWPLSLYLPEIGISQAGFAMTASVITLLPAFCVFFFGQDYLEQGIASSGIKG